MVRKFELPFLLSQLYVVIVVPHDRPHIHSISKLFVLGDSYVDTGNNKLTVQAWKFPFGETFPGFPTGRYSDGLVFTDFLASFMGLRSPMPYEQWNNLSKRRVRSGMNFAHGGAGVFNTYHKVPNITTQINTFKQYIVEGVYNKNDLEKAMALVALSGNDYQQYIIDGGTDEGFRAFVVKVLDQLELNLREIGKIGLKKVVMLNLEPLGCLPNKAVLMSYEKCDKHANNETMFHNMLLQQIVQRLNNETTDSPFQILDLYSAFLSVINKQGGEDYSGITKSRSFEFGNPLLKPCCIATSAEYLCGSVDGNGVKQYTLCENPTDNIFWDAVHPSQSGWKAIFSALGSSLTELHSHLNIHPQRPSLSGSGAISKYGHARRKISVS
ncbi:hypothetical protein MKW98_031087 [Papaver atlanticum]|uniref:GDSL esterase/lipase n=1 Tax=Papaver atlanticum TaxID=357466 RepID=A0AAD4SWB6_9MAGN|nr:hypothetical protein MKW98_031087 [Papaver atlanticum]